MRDSTSGVRLRRGLLSALEIGGVGIMLLTLWQVNEYLADYVVFGGEVTRSAWTRDLLMVFGAALVQVGVVQGLVAVARASRGSR